MSALMIHFGGLPVRPVHQTASCKRLFAGGLLASTPRSDACSWLSPAYLQASPGAGGSIQNERSRT